MAPERRNSGARETVVARLRHCKHAMTRCNRDPLLRGGREAARDCATCDVK
jgi:hypothetical protein